MPNGANNTNMKVTVDNPVRVDEKKVDSGGKLYIGNAWSGKNVKFVVESVTDPDDDPDDE